MASCLCCILATISSNMRCRLFLAKQQLSQSGIVSMFCSPKTFSIKIMPSSLEQFWKIISNSLLPDFSLKIQWFLRRPQFETSSLLFNFEILTISRWSEMQFLDFSKGFISLMGIVLQKLKSNWKEDFWVIFILLLRWMCVSCAWIICAAICGIGGNDALAPLEWRKV